MWPILAPNGEPKLTLTFFLQTDYSKKPWELFVEFDGVRYDPSKIDYVTSKRIVMQDGSEVLFKEKGPDA